MSGEFDSGGLIPGAALETVSGADVIATILVAAFTASGPRCKVSDINTEPGVLVTVGAQVAAAISLTITDGQIPTLHAIGNPDKLGRLQPPPA